MRETDRALALRGIDAAAAVRAKRHHRSGQIEHAELAVGQHQSGEVPLAISFPGLEDDGLVLLLEPFRARALAALLETEAHQAERRA